MPITIQPANLRFKNASGEYIEADTLRGYSPTIAISDIAGGHRATVTDEDGVRNFDILDGAAGNGIADVVLNPDYTLTITYDNGITYTTASIRGERGADGLSPSVAVTEIEGGHRVTITDADGVHPFDVADGTDGVSGQDGVSPSVAVTEMAGGHRVIVTDVEGTKTFEIMDGADGQPGAPGDDGFSPTASVSKSGSTATISITDKNGTTTATVNDGQDGAPGVGVPAGGNKNQMLVKTSDTDYDTAWATPTEAPVASVNGKTGAVVLDAQDVGAYEKPSTGIPASDIADGVIPTVPVQDVQVNGTSVLSNGVANVPVANSSTYGTIKIENYAHGLWMTGGKIAVDTASLAKIKAGTNVYSPITPYNEDASAFYGLAKAAGDTTQSSSSNAVGNYTETAQSKISEMLNAPITVSGSTPSITAKAGIRYVCGEVATLSFTPSATGICDVIFESGSTATVLTVPNTVKWPAWFDPTSLEANATYEINVMDGVYGAVCVWT